MFLLVVPVQNALHFPRQDVPDVQSSVSRASSHVAAIRTASSSRWTSADQVLRPDKKNRNTRTGGSPEGDSGPVGSTLEALSAEDTNTELELLQPPSQRGRSKKKGGSTGAAPSHPSSRGYLRVCLTALVRRSMIFSRSSLEQVSSSVRSWFRSNEVTLPSSSSSRTMLSALNTHAR